MSFSAVATDPRLPEQSHGDILLIERLDAELVRTGISYCRSLKRDAPFPSRASLMSCLSPRMRPGILLVEPLEGGADYEFREVGADLTRAFEEDFTGRRLSDIIHTAPKFGLGLRDAVRNGARQRRPAGLSWLDRPRLAGCGFRLSR